MSDKVEIMMFKPQADGGVHIVLKFQHDNIADIVEFPLHFWQRNTLGLDIHGNEFGRIESMEVRVENGKAVP
jgi:hypothetical protein